MADAPDVQELHRRWTDLWRRAGFGPEGAEPTFARLRDLYTEPGRHYHALRHLSECLGLCSAARTLACDGVAVEMAIWFHDAVYDATRADNEERSAELAAGCLAASGADRSFIDHVQQLILATRHAEIPRDPDAALLVDIDLAILGQPWDRFEQYERDVRREYAHVPDEAFRAGRAAVLRRFLARPSIYSTERFRAWFETLARENLARSLALLSA